jgi:hypothetical protein
LKLRVTTLDGAGTTEEVRCYGDQTLTKPLPKMLAQARPAGTGSVSFYAPSMYSRITSLVIVNTDASFSSNASVYFDAVGNTRSQATALLYTEPIAAGSPGVIFSNLDWGLAYPGEVGIQTSIGNALTFTIYGEDYV